MRMTDLGTMFKTNPEREVEGVVLCFGDAEIRVARAGGANTKFTRLFEERTRPYRKQIEMKVIKDDVMVRLLAEVYAESILVSWRTRIVTKDEFDADVVSYDDTITVNGEKLVFNRDNAIKLLTSVPLVFQEVREVSMAFTNFQDAEALETDAKN
jgi:hypothetical protein